MKIHRLSIVVGEGKSEVFYRDFTCNATKDYYILPKDKRVKKAAIDQVDVHGVTHERYYAAVWLASDDKVKEFTAILQQMAIEHFESCERLAKQGLELTKNNTILPDMVN